jgi:hypothetical protein
VYRRPPRFHTFVTRVGGSRVVLGGQGDAKRSRTQRNDSKRVTDQRSKDMVTITKRMTVKEVGRSRRDGTVRAFAIDVRRHGLGVENARFHIHAPRAINSSRVVS